jgi:tetratricopeptide (TPR) repeat protein
MCKWRKIFKIFLPGIFLLSGSGYPAQEETLVRAQQLLLAKEPDHAALAIDSVITHPETKGDFISWTTRAYIYFDLYKRSDRLKLNSPLRDTILSSLRISQSLKPDSVYGDNNKKLLINLASGYYNLGKLLLQDSLDSEKSHVAYKKFKEIYLMAEPNTSLLQRDIDYYLVAGSIFADIFNRDNNNVKSGETAKVSLLKVLELQPDHPNALMNMGLMYYNQAVNLTKSLDFGADLKQIDIVQENMVKLAKQSEQFIVRVYNDDNTNPKAVEALYYIYRMLNDFERSNDFKAKCKALGVDVTQSEGDNQNVNPK